MSKTAKKQDSKAAEEYLAKKLKPAVEAVKSPTKKLIINTSPLDSEGNSIKQHMGSFHIMGTDLYAERIKFRPIAVYNKLIKMVQTKTKEGADKWSYVNETVYFINYSDVMYDIKGGYACGKLLGEARKNMNKDEAKANNDKAKTYLYLYGLAQFPGTKEWHLVDFRVGGKRIISISDAVSTKTIGKGHFMGQFIFDLACIPNRVSVHPDLDMSIDQRAGLQDVSDIMEYDTMITDFIEESNDRVIASFKKYNQQAQAAVVEDDLNDSLDDLIIPDEA